MVLKDTFFKTVFVLTVALWHVELHTKFIRYERPKVLSVEYKGAKMVLKDTFLKLSLCSLWLCGMLSYIISLYERLFYDNKITCIDC